MPCRGVEGGPAGPSRAIDTDVFNERGLADG